MKDLVKHKIAKEIYADGKAFLWGCLVSLLTLCIVMLCDWLECLNDDYKVLWCVFFYGSPFFAIMIRYMIIAYKRVIKWK